MLGSRHISLTVAVYSATSSTVTTPFASARLGVLSPYASPPALYDSERRTSGFGVIWLGLGIVFPRRSTTRSLDLDG